MTLRADFTKVENFEEVCYTTFENKTYQHPVTQSLIYTLAGIGMCEITDKNWQKVFLRTRMWEEGIYGGKGGSIYPPVSEDPEQTPRMISPEDVKRHIGLTVNVIPVSDAAFRKNLVNLIEARIQRENKDALDG